MTEDAINEVVRSALADLDIQTREASNTVDVYVSNELYEAARPFAQFFACLVSAAFRFESAQC